MLHSQFGAVRGIRATRAFACRQLLESLRACTVNDMRTALASKLSLPVEVSITIGLKFQAKGKNLWGDRDSSQ